MYTLYDYLPSGNGYKVRMLLARLARPYRLVELDIERGETRTPEFLALNPNGRIPLLVDGERRLAESNAILCYLAQDTSFLPADTWLRAQVLQWLFFEQYSHEPNIAVLRFWRHSGARPDDDPEVARRREAGNAALGVMEDRLGGRRRLVGDDTTVADLALFAYTHVAGEGGFDLSGYPAIQTWLAGIAGEARHVAIDARIRS